MPQMPPEIGVRAPIAAAWLNGLRAYALGLDFDISPPLEWTRVGRKRLLKVGGEPTLIFAKATGGIPAIGGATPGSATVRKYLFDGSDLIDSGVDVTAYNFAPTAIGVGKVVVLGRIDKAYFVVSDSC